MIDPMVGEIMFFAGTYAPYGWLACEGQLLSINEYQALYSLLGTNYGGDGVSTFGLPDLRNRLPVGTSYSDVRLALGASVDANDAKEGDGGASIPTLEMTACIAVSGTFPTRS